MVVCPMCAGKGRVSKSAGHPLWRLRPYEVELVSCPLCKGAGETTDEAVAEYKTIRGKLKYQREISRLS